MLGWLKRVFRSAPAGDPPKSDNQARIEAPQDQPAKDVVTMADLQSAQWSDTDVIDHMRFIATLQLRTPLRVLRRHGEVHTDRDSAPPIIAEQPWEGIWCPVTKSWETLFPGRGLAEAFEATSTMSSDIGYIPSDGGEYLQLLLAIRTIVEGDDPLLRRRDRLKELLQGEHWQESLGKLGGVDAVVVRFFPTFLSTVSGLPEQTIHAMQQAGLDSPMAISRCDDAGLLAFKGIGPRKLETLRAACLEAPYPDLPYTVSTRMGIT